MTRDFPTAEKKVNRKGINLKNRKCRRYHSNLRLSLQRFFSKILAKRQKHMGFPNRSLCFFQSNGVFFSITLPETNMAPENNPPGKGEILLETIIFCCYVSFRECRFWYALRWKLQGLLMSWHFFLGKVSAQKGICWYLKNRTQRFPTSNTFFFN